MAQDCLGQELQPGDRIAYARIGHGTDHGSMAVGYIEVIDQKTEGYGSYARTVPTFTVKWIFPDKRWEPKRSTVTKSENILKLA